MYSYITEAYQSLRHHKARTLSTGFGVMWALFLLVVLLGLGEGFYKKTMQQFAGYSANVVEIWLWKGSAQFTETLIAHLPIRFTWIQDSTPYCFDQKPVLHRAESIQQVPIIGVGRQYSTIKNVTLQQGRFFTKQDEALARPVCILSSTIHTQLFKNESPLGQWISLGGASFQVIGVLDATNIGYERQILIPLETQKN